MVSVPDLLTHLDLANAARLVDHSAPFERGFPGLPGIETSMIWINGFPAAFDRAIDVAEWEFTGVFFDAAEKIARILLCSSIATLCVSCRTDNRLGSSQTTPIIDSSEMSAREDCLYREVGRLLEPKGSPPTSLHDIAATATRFCSEAIRSRFQRASVSARDAQALAKDDQARTEQRAFAIGLELRESRSVGVAGN